MVCRCERADRLSGESRGKRDEGSLTGLPQDFEKSCRLLPGNFFHTDPVIFFPDIFCFPNLSFNLLVIGLPV